MSISRRSSGCVVKLTLTNVVIEIVSLSTLRKSKVFFSGFLLHAKFCLS